MKEGGGDCCLEHYATLCPTGVVCIQSCNVIIEWKKIFLLEIVKYSSSIDACIKQMCECVCVCVYKPVISVGK